MARLTGVFWRVGAIVEAFVALGCEVRELEVTETAPEGDVFNLRILVRPSTTAFVTLVDLADDDRVSDDEVEFWEQRLGLTIGRPPTS